MAAQAETGSEYPRMESAQAAGRDSEAVEMVFEPAGMDFVAAEMDFVAVGTGSEAADTDSAAADTDSAAADTDSGVAEMALPGTGLPQEEVGEPSVPAWDRWRN